MGHAYAGTGHQFAAKHSACRTPAPPHPPVHRPVAPLSTMRPNPIHHRRWSLFAELFVFVVLIVAAIAFITPQYGSGSNAKEELDARLDHRQPVAVARPLSHRPRRLSPSLDDLLRPPSIIATRQAPSPFAAPPPLPGNPSQACFNSLFAIRHSLLRPRPATDISPTAGTAPTQNTPPTCSTPGAAPSNTAPGSDDETVGHLEIKGRLDTETILTYAVGEFALQNCLTIFFQSEKGRAASSPL